MKHGDLLVVVVDGQGGGMGRGLVESIKKKWPKLHVRAVGTNSLATSAMLRAGADDGATGENAVVFNARQADLLLGPIGILTPNGLLGEVSPAMQWPMWAVYSTMLIGFTLGIARGIQQGILHIMHFSQKELTTLEQTMQDAAQEAAAGKRMEGGAD